MGMFPWNAFLSQQLNKYNPVINHIFSLLVNFASCYKVRLTFKFLLPSIHLGENHSMALVEECQTEVILHIAWYQSQYSAEQSTLVDLLVHLASYMGL